MERRTKPAISKLRLPFFKRLKGRGARASDITNVSSDAFILFDRNLNIVGMNPVVRSMFHLILGENVIGEKVPTGAPNMKRDNKNNGRYEKYLNAIRKGKPFFADSIVVHSGLLDINIKAEAFKVGKGFGIIFSDLDALKKAEKTPYDSEKGLAISLQSAPDCIFIFDLKGTILHGSRAGERLMGYAWEEIKGKSFFEIPLFAPEYLPKAAQLLELSASGKPAGPDEFELIRKDGGHVFVEISTCPIGRGEELEIVGIAHDITERKKSEEALRKSEERYEAIVETSLDGIYQVDTSSKFTFINEAFANAFGYKREELLGRQFSFLLSTEIIPKVAGMVKEVLAGKDVRDEVPVQHKDGHEVMVNFSATPLKDCGKIIGLTGILRDITEQKRTVRALRESEEKYIALVEAAVRAGEGIVVLQDTGDKEGVFVFVNDKFCEMVGYSRNELLAMMARDLISPDDFTEIQERYRRRQKGEDVTGHYELTLLRKDGTSMLAEVGLSTMPYSGEISTVVFLRDITKRKHTEKMLLESEARYRALFEGSLEGIGISQGSRMVMVNNALLNMLGYENLEELLKVPLLDHIAPTFRQMIRERIERREKGEFLNSKYECEFVNRKGEIKYFEVSVAEITIDGERYVQSNFRDMTEKRRAEEEIAKSEAKYRSLIETAGAGVAVTDLRGDFVLVNEALCRMTGYSQEESLGRSFADFLHPDDKNEVLEIFAQGLAGEREPPHLEFRVIHKDGHNVWCYSTPTAIVHGNELIGFSAIIHDITERKRMEEALKQSEERFRNVLDNSLDMVYRLNLQIGRYDYVSPSTEKILGYSPEEFVAFTIEKGRSLAHPDDLARLDENVVELVTSKEGTPSTIEYRIKHKELGYRWVSDSRSVVYDDANNSIAVVGNLRDITERIEAEAELWGTRERLQLMFDSVQDGVCVTDLEGFITDVNPKALEMYRVSTKEGVAGKSAFELIVPEEMGKAVAEMQKVLEQGTTGLIEHNVVRADGSGFLAELNVSLLKDVSGNATGFVAVLRDITERKQMEEVLSQSEARFRSVLNNSPDLIYRMDLRTGKYDYLSPASRALLGYSPEEYAALSLEEDLEIVHPEDRDMLVENCLNIVTHPREEGKYSRIEYRALHRELGYRWFSDSRAVIYDDRNAPVAVIGNLRDITERKQAEEAVRESEGKFRSVLEHSVDVIYQVNLKTGTYDYVSPSSIEALGYSPEELIALGFEKATSVIHPDDVDVMRAHFNKLMKCATADDEEPPTIEYRIQHRKSGYRWMSDTSSVLCDDNNVPIAITGNVRDITKRKKAEEALKESEERYRALVDTAGLAGEGIMIVERAEGDKAVIAFVNDALSGMLGYQQEEMPGMPARDLFLPGDRIWLRDSHRRKRKGAALPKHYGVMALRKDGSMLPIEISMGAMKYQGKSATVVYVRDVTERKQAEEALRESEAQFRAIFDGAAIGVGLLDVNGQPFRINPALGEMFGYTVEELRSKAFSEYMHPDDAKLDLKLFREMVAGKRDHYQVEKRFIKKDGQIVWGRVTLSAVHGLGGKLLFAIDMIEDITDSKLALENLRKSEERFRSLTENASEVVLIIDKEGAITYASPSVERILGYKLEEGIGKASFSFIHPDDMPQVMGLFEQMMQNPGGTTTAKVRVQHKDGSWLVAEAIGRNLLDNPAVGGIVVNYRDVTEREQAQEELLQHTKQVEALYGIAQAASQTLELEELLSTSLDKVIEVMEAEAGCVFLLDMVEKELVLRTSRGLSDETISKLATIKLNENNVQKILEWKGGSTPLRKIFEEIGLSITKEAKEKEQIQSFAVAPFAVRGQLSGLIAVGNRAYRKFSHGDMDLLRAVGNQIGIGTQNAMLYEEVRALIRETIDAQETERERVCLEVHDGVAQTLVSAFQYLQALEATAPDDAQTKQLLAKTSAQVKQAIQESREVINSLQPATLSDLGLVSTLRQELKRLGQETGLKIDFKADAIRLPKDIETGLYRIIREAVFNARKHANTKQLRVKINSEDERVRVEVRDWGKGFDQAYLDRARKRGTGLFSIRKRAELMKGACEIQSEPGQGTTVRVEIPVSAAERSSE